MFETFVSTRFLCNNQCPQRNFYAAGYTTAVCLVQSNGRQEEPTAPTSARLIGCGGRAAAAVAAVVGTHDLAALRRVRSVTGYYGKANDDNVRNNLRTAVD